MPNSIDSNNSVELIPIFENNYIFMIVNSKDQTVILVDPGEATSVIQILNDRKLKLLGILITHHHLDHIGGLLELKEKYDVPIYAPLKNKNQIASATEFIQQGDPIKLGNYDIKVFELPGHTLGHVAYYFQQEDWLFSGDVLFGLGCGRLFEGTPLQMYDSLQIIKSLPDETKIFCAHEYTEINLRFTQSLLSLDQFKNLIDTPDISNYETQLKKWRENQIPSVPLTLKIEKKANLFLRANSPEQFAEMRSLRNRF